MVGGDSESLQVSASAATTIPQGLLTPSEEDGQSGGEGELVPPVDKGKAKATEEGEEDKDRKNTLDRFSCHIWKTPLPPRPRPSSTTAAPSYRAPTRSSLFSFSASSFTFQAGVFPLPGMSMAWSWPPQPQLPPASLVEERINLGLRDPHGAAEVPPHQQRMAAMMQQAFMFLFFAVFNGVLTQRYPLTSAASKIAPRALLANLKSVLERLRHSLASLSFFGDKPDTPELSDG
ncbi:hypothetical protein JCM11641_006230 [Rhodosporidiobolus odoratus]